MSLAAACDVHPELAAAALMSGDEFRNGIAFCAAYDALRKQLELDAAALAYAVNSKRADLANRARRVLTIAESMNQPEGTEVPVPLIDTIRATFKRPKKRTAITAPATPPVTPTPPVSNTPPVTTTPPASTPPVTTQPLPPAVPAATTAPAPAVVKV